MDEKKLRKSRIEELEEHINSILKEMGKLEKEMRASLKAKDDATFKRAGDRFTKLSKEAMKIFSSSELQEAYQARANDKAKKVAELFLKAIETGRPEVLEGIKQIMGTKSRKGAR